MNKECLILKLMEELGITLQSLMGAANCFDSEGNFTLPLYVNKDVITKDPNYFEEDPQIKPLGVVIGQVVYPFFDGESYQEVTHRERYNLYSKVKARGTNFPSENELEALALSFKKYKAIAEYFGLKAYARCVFDHPSNNDAWINYYDLAKGKTNAHDASCPYFEVIHL